MIRIAMWSGPRNISTAMMRSWQNRPDTVVCDEPLYAHYLLKTGVNHPGRDEVIARHETDWRRIVDGLLHDEFDGAAVYYQKHMAHHLLPEIDRGWLDSLTHAFLIRAPREMLTSLLRNVPTPRIEDTGLPQQVDLLHHVQQRTGRSPPIVDARDVLENPRRMLTLLCEQLGVPFREEMLSWPPGRRETDGVWAKHWYAAVERSTGFEPYHPKDEPVPPHLHGLLAECERLYGELHSLHLR
jgi:hypothetical protein